MAQGVLDRLTLQSGDFVFKEGEEGNQAYVVQEGTIDIVRKNSEGEDIVLGTVEKGAIFGEMALIDDQPRMATARAASPASVRWWANNSGGAVSAKWASIAFAMRPCSSWRWPRSRLS